MRISSVGTQNVSDREIRSGRGEREKREREKRGGFDPAETWDQMIQMNDDIIRR